MSRVAKLVGHCWAVVGKTQTCRESKETREPTGPEECQTPRFTATNPTNKKYYTVNGAEKGKSFIKRTWEKCVNVDLFVK